MNGAITMSLCSMRELLQAAQKENRAVGAFSVGNMEMILGAVKAAQEAATPIILQIAQVRLKHSPLCLMGPMMVSAAREAKVDIAVHLDHGLDYETVREALGYGFTSVMFDGSRFPLQENMEKTAAVSALARTHGASVEAEIGVVGGTEDGGEAQAVCTSAGDAAAFCAGTDIDALAVSIGNAHGNYKAAPRLRFDVLEEIARVAPLPLVLHGGTGIPDGDFRIALEKGIRKINIATASFDALASGVKKAIAGNEGCSYFDLNEAMVQSVYENVRRHIRIFNNREPL